MWITPWSSTSWLWPQYIIDSCVFKSFRFYLEFAEKVINDRDLYGGRNAWKCFQSCWKLSSKSNSMDLCWWTRITEKITQAWYCWARNIFRLVKCCFLQIDPRIRFPVVPLLKKEQPPINFKTSSFNRLRRRTEYGLAQVQKHFWLGISDFCSSLKEFWKREDTFRRLKVVRCLKMDPKLKGHLFLDALTSLDFKLSLSG